MKYIKKRETLIKERGEGHEGQKNEDIDAKGHFSHYSLLKVFSDRDVHICDEDMAIPRPHDPKRHPEGGNSLHITRSAPMILVSARN